MADEYATGGFLHLEDMPFRDPGGCCKPTGYETPTDVVTTEPRCWYCSLPPEHRGCPVHRDGDG